MRRLAVLAAIVTSTLTGASAAEAVAPPSCGPPTVPGSPGCQLPGGSSPGPGGTLERGVTVNITTPTSAPYPDCNGVVFPCVLNRIPAQITSVSASASDQFGNTGGGNPLAATFQENSPCAGQTTCSGKVRYLSGLTHAVVRVNYVYGQYATGPFVFGALIGTDTYLVPLSAVAPPPGPPRIDSITLAEPSVQTGRFQALQPAGTTDGNQLQITARVRNPLTSPIAATVSFLDDLTNLPRPGGKRTLTLPAGGVVDVNMLLDTNGYAWLDGYRANRDMRVQVELVAGGTSSVKSVPLIVRPKPLVLVHGVNATHTTFRAYPGDGGFPARAHPGWRGYVVGDGQSEGVMNANPFSPGMRTTRGNAAQVATYVNGVRARTNAAHVDLVAHSLGGLISRRYIHEFMPMAADGKPVASHLLTMGTPHLGSACGDVMSGTFLSLGQSKPGIEELTRYAALDFNRDVTDRKGVRFAGLIGNPSLVTCHEVARGDDYVSVPSARWTLADTETLPMKHTSMTSSPDAFAFIISRLALDRNQANLRQSRRPPSAQPAEARASGTPRSCAAGSRSPVQLRASFVRALRGRGKARFAIPVTRAKRLNVVMMLPLSVRATLRDPAGKVRAGSPETAGGTDGSTRTLTVRKPRAGNWRLELAETAGRPGGVAVAAVLTGSKERLRVGATRGKRRTLVIRATALRGKSRIRRLRVSGRLSVAGQKIRLLRLRDTGRSGDRKARDGTYTARVRRVPAKDASIAVSAKGKGFRLTSITGSCAG